MLLPLALRNSFKFSLRELSSVHFPIRGSSPTATATKATEIKRLNFIVVTVKWVILKKCFNRMEDLGNENLFSGSPFIESDWKLFPMHVTTEIRLHYCVKYMPVINVPLKSCPGRHPYTDDWITQSPFSCQSFNLIHRHRIMIPLITKKPEFKLDTYLTFAFAVNLWYRNINS